MQEWIVQKKLKVAVLFALFEAFETMLPAVGRLVGHHFQRLLIADARTRLAGADDPR